MRRRRPPEDSLTKKIRLARERGDERERDLLVAMIVVRALERARELAGVERSGLALRRALSASEKPLAGYLERHLARGAEKPRKKA